MNYKKINSSIIDKKDYLKPDEKNRDLYKYLLDNNVAYYYSKVISKNKNKFEKKIIDTGNRFNIKYVKTLRLLDVISRRNNVVFLLFKTYKYISEAVDGDIDIIVREEDFSRWISLLKKEGFRCKEEKNFPKASCSKRGFCRIEPRVYISFHEYKVISTDKIWDSIESVRISGIEVKKASTDVDLYALLLNSLYGPNYIKLYLLSIQKNMSLKRMSQKLDTVLYEDLSLIAREISHHMDISSKLPFFLGDVVFFNWWIKRIFFSDRFSLFYKTKHLVFFYYIKYKYLLFSNVHFAHEWKIL